MHILVAGDRQNVERIFEYCQKYQITMYYGRIDHEYHDIAWQILHDGNKYIDLLLMLFPAELKVISPF